MQGEKKYALFSEYGLVGQNLSETDIKQIESKNNNLSFIKIETQNLTKFEIEFYKNNIISSVKDTALN